MRTTSTDLSALSKEHRTLCYYTCIVGRDANDHTYTNKPHTCTTKSHTYTNKPHTCTTKPHACTNQTPYLHNHFLCSYKPYYLIYLFNPYSILAQTKLQIAQLNTTFAQTVHAATLDQPNRHTYILVWNKSHTYKKHNPQFVIQLCY